MTQPQLTSALNRWQTIALAAGGIASGLSLAGGWFNHAQFFHSYLFAWLFWIGLSLGGLVVVMMQNLTGGMWGLAVRNLCIGAIMALPLLVLLFAPVLFGLHDIYGWANGILSSTPGAHHKQQYLNVPFFIGRSLFYFAVLLVFGFVLRRRYHEQPARSPVALSASGLISYVLCMNFASTDWVMSLTPEWYSTIFVIVFMAGQFLAALALTTALLCLLSDPERVPTKALHDLGNMVLAFVIFWIYVSFSQLLIIWSGNLPKEISWYLPRSRGGWQWVALVLTVGEFLLPFALLLSREAKRSRYWLAGICLCIVAMSVVNNFWLVAPAFHPKGFFVHWLDVTELLGIGGFWFALFLRSLKSRPLIAFPLLEARQHG
ncbi:MAG: hypothetical protein ACJ8M1_06130 [Chthoniobacterales bacterium]